MEEETLTKSWKKKYTHKMWRKFMRKMTKETVLYTEMIVARAAYHHRKYLTQHSPEQNPVVIQFGASEPSMLPELIKECQNFSGVNLNCGCPAKSTSSRRKKIVSAISSFSYG